MAEAIRHSLCWDCANSTTKGCAWAENFAPVEGWTAEKTEASYLVTACPELRRDSYGFGLYRHEEDLLRLIERRRRKWK